MRNWYPEQTHQECLEIYENIKEETQQYIEKEHGTSGLSDPDLVWEVAQSAPSYQDMDGLEDYLKMTEAIHDKLLHDVDWSQCMKRIRQYVVPEAHSDLSEYMPARYLRDAGEEIILHAVTYEITGEGRS